MIFVEGVNYSIVERVRDVSSITPNVEFDYRDHHNSLRGHLQGFKVFHAQGYEAVLN